MLAWSFFASVLVHILFLLLSPLLIQTETPPGGAAPAVAETPERFGMQMIIAVPSATAPDVPPVQETDPMIPPPVQAPPQATPPQVEAGAAPAGPPAPDVQQPAGAPGTAHDPLRPGYRDPRFYVTPSPLPRVQGSEHERYMEHLQARIDAVNDSMAIEARRDRRTADWVITDGSGNRWGVSSEGLHLGGVTIPRQLLPLPAPTGDNQSLEGERERQRQRDEIRRQEETRERQQTQREREEAAQRQ